MIHSKHYKRVMRRSLCGSYLFISCSWSFLTSPLGTLLLYGTVGRPSLLSSPISILLLEIILRINKIYSRVSKTMNVIGGNARIWEPFCQAIDGSVNLRTVRVFSSFSSLFSFLPYSPPTPPHPSFLFRLITYTIRRTSHWKHSANLWRQCGSTTCLLHPFQHQISPTIHYPSDHYLVTFIFQDVSSSLLSSKRAFVMTNRWLPIVMLIIFFLFFFN